MKLTRSVKRLFTPKRPPMTPATQPADPENIQNAMILRHAKYPIGQMVRHRVFDFRGVIFDVDPVFANSEEWYQSIPEEVRPAKNQPYYHLFAENDRTCYIAYVSEQNLIPDETQAQIRHPDIARRFDYTNGGYILKSDQHN